MNEMHYAKDAIECRGGKGRVYVNVLLQWP